jgi:hypothetical protein
MLDNARIIADNEGMSKPITRCKKHIWLPAFEGERVIRCTSPYEGEGKPFIMIGDPYCWFGADDFRDWSHVFTCSECGEVGAMFSSGVRRDPMAGVRRAEMLRRIKFWAEAPRVSPELAEMLARTAEKG